MQGAVTMGIQLWITLTGISGGIFLGLLLYGMTH